MSKIYYCKNCINNLREIAEKQYAIWEYNIVIYENDPDNYCGYWDDGEYLPKNKKCMKCNSELVLMNLSIEEFSQIQRISKNPDYILAMNNLKEKDIIEFESKMENIRQQLSDRDNQAKVQREAQQKVVKQESNTRHCPKCGSTNFTPVRKKYGLFMGFATNKVELVCNNCGYRMKAEN